MNRTSVIPNAPAVDTRFVYLAPKDVQIARVARKCMMHLCEALVVAGADVELICLRVEVMESEPTAERTIWDVFGIEQEFRVTMIPTAIRQRSMDSKWVRGAITGYRLLVYPWYALRAHLRSGPEGRRPARTVFYSRNYGCLAGVLALRWLLGKRARMIIEVHVVPVGRLRRALVRMADGVAAQSLALRERLVQEGLVSEQASVGRHTGFSPALTKRVRMTRGEARRELRWPETDRIVCYTGKVYWGMDEIELLVQAAALLAEEGIRFVFVGGRSDQAALWSDEVALRGVSNAEFVGFVAPSDALLYQMAADALVLYYSSGIALNEYRSPGKLFEYMASGTPAVVADFPSIREVIRPGQNGLLVEPDRPDLLAQALRSLFADPELAERLARTAQSDAEDYTWSATACATLELVSRLWDGEGA